MSSELLNFVLWTTLERIAPKQARRELLEGGESYEFVLRIDGTIRQKPVRQRVEGRLLVNHDQERCASQAPPTPHLVAVFLAMLPKKKQREALANLPAEFTANENRLPDVPAELHEAAEKLLEQLRAKKVQTVKSAVSAAYEVRE